MNIVKRTVVLFLLFSLVCAESSAGFVVGHNETNPAVIPRIWVHEAKNSLNIAYNHTSHGSQIITGPTNGITDRKPITMPQKITPGIPTM